MSRPDHRSKVWMSAGAYAKGCRCSVTVSVVHGADGQSISKHRCSPLHEPIVRELEDVAKSKLKAALRS